GDNFTIHDSEIQRDYKIELYSIHPDLYSWEERIWDRGSFQGSYHFDAVLDSDCKVSRAKFAPPKSGSTTVTPGGLNVDTTQLCHPASTGPGGVRFTKKDEEGHEHEFRAIDRQSFYELSELAPGHTLPFDFDVDKDSCSVYWTTFVAPAFRGRRSDVKPYR